MATTEQARNEVLGLLERLKQDSDALAKALQALVGEAGQPQAEHPVQKPPLSDREAFLSMKEKLLAEYGGMWVAFAQGRLIAASHSFDELMKSVATVDAAVDVYVEPVSEEAFLEPPPFDADGVHEIYEDSEGLP